MAFTRWDTEEHAAYLHVDRGPIGIDEGQLLTGSDRFIICILVGAALPHAPQSGLPRRTGAETNKERKDCPSNLILPQFTANVNTKIGKMQDKM